MNAKFAVMFSVVGAAMIALTVAWGPASSQQAKAEGAGDSAMSCCGIECDPEDCILCDEEDCARLCKECKDQGDCCCIVCCDVEACPLDADGKAAKTQGAAGASKSDAKACSLKSACCGATANQP